MEVSHLFVLFILISLKVTKTFSAFACELETTRENAPMIIKQTNNQFDSFKYPADGKKTIDFTSEESVALVCPGQAIKIGSQSYNNITSVSCQSGNKLKINGTVVDWTKIECSGNARRTAKKSGNKCGKGIQVYIGFEVNESFLKVLDLCFDETKQQALYSQINITASINQRITGTPRPTWLQSNDIFKVASPNLYYNRTVQRETINSLLGLPETSTKYIQNNNYYLSRGHMSARSDNFYPAQQNVTFFLLNAAPQWQTNNEGNWESVEESVRSYAENNNVNITQWTGVYGVTTLPHAITNQSVELYLYNNEGTKLFPVPEFYWKIAYDPKSQRAIAIIVINNPYIETYKPICEDISNKISWVKWEKDNQEKGFGYICTIETFRKAVSFVPQFNVQDILL